MLLRAKYVLQVTFVQMQQHPQNNAQRDSTHRPMELMCLAAVATLEPTRPQQEQHRAQLVNLDTFVLMELIELLVLQAKRIQTLVQSLQVPASIA